MLRSLICLALVTLAACSSAPEPVPQLRLTPAELQADGASTEQIGSSKLPGVHSKVLTGNPNKPGFYTILLFVPPETTIAAHSHKDDRIATVVSGNWSFGYGEHFDAAALKSLPPGSVYSEPGGAQHFARTSADAVVVQISGYGPTDTVYFDPHNDPTRHE